MTRYRWILFGVFLIVWAWGAWKPKHPEDWLIENILIFASVPLVFLVGRHFRLSDISYTLIAVFLCAHVVGSHYTYAEVPFGYTLQRWLGSNRNQYDRLIHFSFGLLMAYPMREIFVRLARVRGVWGYFFPFEFTLAMSGIYEVVEWIVALNVNPSAGTAYLGTQGDEWDAQKDMLCAGVGAVMAMLVVALIHWRYRGREFWAELKESLRRPPGDQPLGEEALEDLRISRRIS